MEMKKEEEGLNLVKLAEDYGTPVYIYDGDLILKKYKELYKMIKWDKLKIYYAMKANENKTILKLLLDNDAYLDTVSPCEIFLAMKIGYPPHRLLFTANNMKDEEMKEVESTGVLFNIGSLSRLEKYGKAYPGNRICLRINPDVVAGAHKYIQTGGPETKFGILMQDIDTVKKIITKYSLRVIGLQEHTGSGIENSEKIYSAMEALMEVALKFDDLEFLDFGGGFKISYNPMDPKIDYRAFGEEVGRRMSNFSDKYGRELEVYFEPGKYIVGECGTLIVEVNTIKNNRGRIIAGTDSGFSQLIRPLLYQAYHEIINLSNPMGELKEYDICGNICETGDCFAQQRTLPEVNEGHLLAIKNAGAYGYSMASIYNLRAMPPEVIWLNGKVIAASKRITNRQLADILFDQ